MEPDVRSATPPLTPRALARWLWQLTKDVIDEYRTDGVGDLAASITFWTILSVPAAILALVSTLGAAEAIVGAELANDLETEIQGFLDDTLSDSEAVSSAVSELFSSSNAGVATIATLVAIFTLSRAFAGVIRSLDNAYEVEDGRSWWHVRLVAIGLGLGTIVIVASAATLLAILPNLPFGSLARFLTAPAAFLVIVIWSTTLFHVGPYHRTPWRYDLPGGIVTTVGWVTASQGFAVYIRIAGQGNEVQTGVGAILLALSLMYILSIVLLVGAEVNDVIGRRAGVVQQPPSVREQANRVREQMRRRKNPPADAESEVES